MKKNASFSIVILALLLSLVPAAAGAQCGSSNEAFKSGELLSYDLYFNWQFVWMKVGTASMNITQTTYQGQPAYRSYLITRGSKSADRLFVMRDTLTTYTGIDLVPRYYKKRAKEGKDYRCEDVWYDYKGGKCSLRMKFSKNGREPEWRSHSDQHCAYDMISMLLRARSFDATTYKVGQRINFLMAEGKHCEWRQLIYHGKKKLKMKDGRTTYRTLVFSYVEKEKGKEKEIVRFYVTDDKNHLPVCLDLNLTFGSAKAYLRGYKSVRWPMTSKVN